MERIGKPKILIVDDRPENLLAMEMIFENEPCDIIKASSGNEALAHMMAHDFAVVLLDVQMPGMDGFETAELMRGNRKTGHVPIIFVTAISKERQHVFKGYETGAVDYIFKPIEPEILKSKVGVFLRLYNQQKTLEESEARYRGLFDGVPVGLYLYTSEGQFLDANPALMDMLGYSDLESLRTGNVMSLYVDSGDWERWQSQMERDGVVRGFEAQFRRCDGETIWARNTAHAVRNGDGSVLHYEGSLEDITERKQAEETLREQERRLASIETLQQVFITLSHHINNAMTAISGKAQLCELGVVTKEELTGVCEAQTRRVSAVLGALDRMAHEADIRTIDYVGIENAMFDIEEELERTLGEP